MTNKLLLLVLFVLMCVSLSAKDNEHRHKNNVKYRINKTQKNFKLFITRKKYGNRIKKHILVN